MGLLTHFNSTQDRAQEKSGKWTERRNRAFAKIGTGLHEVYKCCSTILSNQLFKEITTPKKDNFKTRTNFESPGQIVAFDSPVSHLKPEKPRAIDSLELITTLNRLHQQPEHSAIEIVRTSPVPRPSFVRLNQEICVDYRASNTEYWRLQEALLAYHRKEGMTIGIESGTFPRSDSPEEYWIKQKARRDWHYNQYQTIIAEKRRMDADMAPLEIRDPRKAMSTMSLDTETRIIDTEAAPAYEACVPYHT